MKYTRLFQLSTLTATQTTTPSPTICFYPTCVPLGYCPYGYWFPPPAQYQCISCPVCLTTAVYYVTTATAAATGPTLYYVTTASAAG